MGELRITIYIVSNLAFFASAELIFINEALFNVWQYFCFWEISNDEGGHI